MIAWIGLSDYGNGIFAQIMPSPLRALSLKPFQILEPGNDASIKTRDIPLKWQCATRETTFYPWEKLDYKVIYSKSSDLSEPMYKSVAADTNTILKALESGQIYFWRVMAYNKNGDSLFSSNSNAFFVRYDATAVSGIMPVPESITLAQNYPNPFNGSTKVFFHLDASAKITLSVWDVLGRRVKTLYEGYHAAGEHSVVWHGTDKNGAPVPSGIYLVRMTGNGFSQTRKVVLAQ